MTKQKIIKCHKNVKLADGVTIPPEAWEQHHEILTEGIPNHRIIINGFIPRHDDDRLWISLTIHPIDEKLPLQFRES